MKVVRWGVGAPGNDLFNCLSVYTLVGERPYSPTFAEKLFKLGQGRHEGWFKVDRENAVPGERLLWADRDALGARAARLVVDHHPFFGERHAMFMADLYARTAARAFPFVDNNHAISPRREDRSKSRRREMREASPSH